MTRFLIAALMALGLVACAAETDETADLASISTKAPHICDDCQSRYHTR